MNYRTWAFMCTVMAAFLTLSLIGICFEQPMTLIAIAILSGIILFVLIVVGKQSHLNE